MIHECQPPFQATNSNSNILYQHPPIAMNQKNVEHKNKQLVMFFSNVIYGTIMGFVENFHQSRKISYAFEFFQRELFFLEDFTKWILHHYIKYGASIFNAPKYDYTLNCVRENNWTTNSNITMVEIFIRFTMISR